MSPAETAEVVSAAALGEPAAWDALVDRYARLVWAVARAFGLSDADAADVSQTTWLRLAEHLPRLREPDRIGAWLATTARREAMRALARARRERPLDGLDFVDTESGLDQRLLETEEAGALWRAFATIPLPCQLLLRLLVADCSYAEISEVLDMPVGSIGPRRGRCLQQLRATVLAGDAGKDTAIKAAPVP
jgi:RNA polymerase sigma factor (sigma-70 family)